MRIVIFSLFVCIAFCTCQNNHHSRTAPWSVEQANRWHQQWGWLRGCNFQPSTAVNTIEMWQADTFDPETIDRELGWAAAIGFNCMRVYLHHVAWEGDREAFKKRMAQYLDISAKHGISTLFVFFDDCWNPTYSAGIQPEPIPGVHNSGWVKDPGDLIDDPETMKLLEIYMKDVITAFKDDKRIVLWDLYNEPGNSSYGQKSLDLVQKAFEWARTVNPSQPLSVGVWDWELEDFNKVQLANSDIITYHDYNNAEKHQQLIDTLRHYAQGRPMVCTEYMARRNGSTFQEIMPMLKRENIGAFNWGLVAGKTNTIYAWGTKHPDDTEPPVWFSDIFRKDGTPFSQEEIDRIKSLCK